MVIQCKDGELQVPELLLQYNQGARKFCNDPKQLEWAKGKDMGTVFVQLSSMPWD